MLWTTDRLRVEPATNTMLCDRCLETGESTSFSTIPGCVNLRLDSIKSHEKSKCHMKVAPRFEKKIGEALEAEDCIIQLK